MRVSSKFQEYNKSRKNRVLQKCQTGEECEQLIIWRCSRVCVCKRHRQQQQMQRSRWQGRRRMAMGIIVPLQLKRHPHHPSRPFRPYDYDASRASRRMLQGEQSTPAVFELLGFSQHKQKQESLHWHVTNKRSLSHFLSPSFNISLSRLCSQSHICGVSLSFALAFLLSRCAFYQF